MTNRIMYDGIAGDAAIIARDFPHAEMVAGYLDGTYAWSLANWALFPFAEHVEIVTRASTNAGDVLDVETGDATPGQTAGWIAMRKAAGLYRPTIYCSLHIVPDVRVGTGKYVLGTDYDIWVADWDGTTALPYPLAVAKQEQSTNSYDISVVYDDQWPHRTAPAPAPKPPVPAAPTLEDVYALNLKIEATIEEIRAMLNPKAA